MNLYSGANLQSITDLRENANQFISQLNKTQRPTIILKGNRPKMVVLSLTYYNKLLDLIEDQEDAFLASELISQAKSKGKNLKTVAKELNISLE